MEIKIMKVSELIPYDRNPRDNDGAVEAVANSIREFGFKVPIVIDKNNEIINGHTRLKAANHIGLDEVPIIRADDLNADQVKAFRLADNKTGEIAEWDFDLLEMELEEISMDMDPFGFDISEFDDDLLEAQEDEFDIDTDVETFVKNGDIFKLGNHRLMCGDSTNAEDIEKLMAEGKADLLITDPPYNVAYVGKTQDALSIKNDGMENEQFEEFLKSAFKNVSKVMNKGAAFYCWYASSMVIHFHNALTSSNFLVKQELIWLKNNIVLGRQDYQWKHEPCLYGWLDGGTHKWYSDRKQTTILEFNKPERNGDHPTMKPIPLFAYQIKNSSKQGDNVLDIFGGSGTTVIACEQSNRNAFVMELDPIYCQVIINRWEEFTGLIAEKVNDDG